MAGGRQEDGGGWTLRLVGPLAVARGGRVLPDTEVGSRKARTLLALLAVQRPATVPVDRVIGALWPDAPPRNPVENVATLVSRLRAALGSDAVAGVRGGYRLGDPAAVGVDLDEAGALVRTARARSAAGEPAPALAAARRALDLLGTGEVLPDQPGADWAEPARAAAARLLRSARHEAAAAGLALPDPAAAVAAAQSAVDVDPLDEIATRLLMRAHQLAGEPARGLAAYARLRMVLAEDLGTDPAAETAAVHAALLRGQQPAAARIRGRPAPGRGPLVGRAAQTARLAALWSAATAGDGGFVLVTGAAGLGKTRLADELAGRAAGTGGRVLQARCYGTERSLFLQPLADALRPVVIGLPAEVLAELAGADPAALAAVVPDVAAILAPAIPPASSPATPPASPPVRDPDVQRRRAFAALTGFLVRLADRAPLLLVLDDLQEAGLATVDFLHHLARHSAGAPLLVVATLRAGEGDEAAARLADVAVPLPVAPLDPASVAELAAAAGHADLATRIYRLTRGHTLFVVETLRGAEAGEPGIPGSLREAVLARVRRLGPEAEEGLRAASVLGPPFDPDTLGGVLGIPGAEAARRCERALRVGLLAVAGDAYEFANDLVQEVLYETTPAPTRVHHHRRAADLLTDRPEAAAGHAAAGGRPVPAARGWLRAGEEALRRWAAADAEAFLDRALGVLPADAAEPELRARLHLARGRAREARGAFDGAWTDHQRAAELAREAGDRRLEMAVLRQLGGDVPIGRGQPMGTCVPYLEAGVRIARALSDPVGEADLLGRLAVVTTNQLRFDLGVRHGRAAVAAAREAGDRAAIAAALDGLKTAYAYLGDLGGLEPVLAELEPLLRAQNDLWRLQWTVLESAYPAVARGEWTAALDRIGAARALNRRSGFSAYEAWFVVQVGWVERLRGRRDAELAAARAAVAVAAGPGQTHPWWPAAAHAFLGGTLLAAGDRAAAVPELETCVRLTTGRGADGLLLRGLAPLAEATGDRHLLARADALLAGISAPAGGAWVLGVDVYLAVARAWLAAGAADRAAAVLDRFLPAAERAGWLPLVALAGELAAVCADATGDPAAAARLRARSTRLAARYGVAVPGLPQKSSASMAAARPAPPGSTGR